MTPSTTTGIPADGTTGPGNTNDATNPTNPNDIAARVLMTQLPAVQAATLAAVTAQVANLNYSLKSNYLTAFNNWLISWTAGRVTDRTTAPAPPLAFVVGYFTDPTTGKEAIGPYGSLPVQWAYPAQGTEPVCAQPAIPDVPPPQVHPVVTGNANLQNVPAGDTMPVGSVIPAPDGSKWEKMASPTPFGVAYYYAKVA